MKTGSAIRDILRIIGMTPAQLNRAIDDEDISKYRMTRILRNLVGPSVQEMTKIMSVLKVTRDDVILRAIEPSDLTGEAANNLKKLYPDMVTAVNESTARIMDRWQGKRKSPNPRQDELIRRYFEDDEILSEDEQEELTSIISSGDADGLIMLLSHKSKPNVPK